MFTFASSIMLLTITHRYDYMQLTRARIYIHVYEYWVINPGGILILVSSKCRDNGDTCAAVTENLCRRISRHIWRIFRRIDANESLPASFNVQPIDFASVCYSFNGNWTVNQYYCNNLWIDTITCKYITVLQFFICLCNNNTCVIQSR